MFFKKYTKDLLDKEVVNTPIPSEQTNPPAYTSFSRPIETPTLTNTALKEELAAAIEPDEDLIPETIIGERVTMKGTVTFMRLLRIDGSFEGEIISEGKIIVGPKGSVKSNINLKEAFISGKVEGDINVKERLVLRGRAEVKGNITASRLSVDEGVSIQGQLTVVATATKEEAP